MFKLKKDRINFKKKLGKGASGAVYAYQKDPDDIKWVVKRMHVGDSDELLSCLPEIVLGFSCDHPCIVPLKGYSIEKGEQEDYYIFLKFPRMKETLKDKFDQQQKSKNHFPEKEIVKYFYSLVCAVDYLHKKKIYHRDIKPGNILLDEDRNAKLSDIGAAKHVIEEEMYQPLSGLGGTVDYTAPELLKDKSNLTKESLIAGDAWSIGLVMLELCALKNRLFNPYSSRETIQENQNSLCDKLKEVYTKPLLNLILKLLSFEPHTRIKISDVKKALEEEYNCQLDDSENIEILKEKHKKVLENSQKSLQDMIASVSLLKQEKIKVQDELKEFRSLIAQYQSQIISGINEIYTQNIEKLKADYEGLLLKQSLLATPNEITKLEEEYFYHEDSVVFVGYCCSGKTNIVRALMKDPFDHYCPGLTERFFLNIYRNNKVFRLEIMDVNGTVDEDYKDFDIKNWSSSLDKIWIIVYNITHRDSFSDVSYWIQKRMECLAKVEDKSRFFIVGAQSDLHHKREVPREEGEDLAAKYGAIHLEVSALEGTNIDQLQERIMDECERKLTQKLTQKTENKKSSKSSFWDFLGFKN